MVKAFVLVMYVLGQGGHGDAKGVGRARFYADEAACTAKALEFVASAAHDPEVKNVGYGCVPVNIGIVGKNTASM